MNSQSKHPPLDLSQFFHCYVLSLQGWEDRLDRFVKRADELGVTGYDVLWGVDGDKIHTPNWWGVNARKWACNLAHLNAVHAGIMAGDKPIMILEDDCHLRENFIPSIHEVIAYFRDTPDATVCFLGGRIHNQGDQVMPHIVRNVKVGGGYGYCISQDHAPVVAGYYMNLPPVGKRGRHGFAQDTKMMRRWQVHKHASVKPVCVGHNGGPSILLKRVRKPRHVDS